MAMKVSVKRLSRLLQIQQFELVDVSRIERSAVFARRSPVHHLFERVKFWCQGKQGEAAVAQADTSVVRGRNVSKGLVEIQPLPELGDVKERVDEHGFWVPGYGRAIIETTEEAKDWERRFAEVAPQQAAILAREKGPELLANTASCRAAAAEMREHLGDVRDVLATCTRLEREADLEQRRQARRLAEWPGVLKISGADMIYEIATLAIVIHASEVSSIRVDVTADPLYDRALMWLIQILVDRIIIETAWQPGSN